MAEQKFRCLNLMMNVGSIDLLEKAKGGQPVSFKTFRETINHETGKKYSSSTISTRLRELVKAGAIEMVPIESESGRKVVGYKITKSGSKALELSYEYEKKLRNILK